MKKAGIFAAAAAVAMLSGCSDNGGDAASAEQAGETRVASAGENKKGNAFKQFAINSLFGSMVATADASEANHRMAQKMK